MMKLLVSLLLILPFALSCNLPCQHGGVPNDLCTLCTGCLGAWTGTYCDTWDSTIPWSKLNEELLFLAQEARTNFTKRQGPKLEVVLGYGVDITTGTPRLPILKLNYSDNWVTSRGRNFLAPNGVSVKDVDVVNSTHVLMFQGIFDYITYLLNYTSKAELDVLGTFDDSPDLVEVYYKYFSSTTQVTLSKWHVSLFTAALTSGVGQFSLDKRAERALHFLPPDYDSVTNKALYRTFVMYWGTDVISSTMMGGSVNLQSFYESKLLNTNGGPFSPTDIKSEALFDFYCKTTNPDYCAYINPQYQGERKLGTLDCVGGNAAELCSTETLGTWMESIWNYPQAITLQVEDFSSLLEEPIRTNIRTAIAEFKKESYDKWMNQYPSCPPCKWGTCTYGQTKCTCYSENIRGTKCDTCYFGWGGPQCSEAVCRYCDPSTGACVGPNECRCFSQQQRGPERRMCPAV